MVLKPVKETRIYNSFTKAQVLQEVLKIVKNIITYKIQIDKLNSLKNSNNFNNNKIHKSKLM